MTVDEAIAALRCVPIKEPHWHIPIIYLTEFVLDSGWTWEELAAAIPMSVADLRSRYKVFGGERWTDIRPTDPVPPRG